MMSGGPMRSFTKGWAVKIFGGRKAHFYERNEIGFAAALCGCDSAVVAQLRAVGNWTKCKTCERKLQPKNDEAAA